MQRVILEKTKEITALNAKVEKLTQKVDEYKQILAIEKTRGGRTMTLQSTFAVGVRMALASCSAGDFPKITMNDISRQTVVRCQIKTGACLIARMRWFAMVFAEFRKPQSYFGDFVFRQSAGYLQANGFRASPSFIGALMLKLLAGRL